MNVNTSMSYSSSSSIPSSSASSPSLGPVDSSPLSSPHPGPISLSDDLDSPPASPGVVHPFAGNTKAVKRIRLYEKSADRWGAELNDAIEDDRSFATLNLDGSMCASSEPSDTEGGDFFACDDDMDESTLADEVDPWAKAISNAIDQGNGLIDLSSTSFGGSITSIPPSISDLDKLVVLLGPNQHTQQRRISPIPISATSSPTKSSSSRRFMRAETAPILFGARHTNDSLFPTSRLASAKAISSHSVLPLKAQASNEVQLYIANHSIRALPTELFWITNLTVLSLRGNKLTSLPSQIVSLPHLRELNVSLNELSYLPAEILSLQLESLSIAGNPWMSSPPKTHTGIHDEINKRPHQGFPTFRWPRHIGEKTRHMTVVPLTELCLRVLMSPAQPTIHTTCIATSEHILPKKREPTMLESIYELPLSRTNVPAHIIDIVYGCIPRSFTDEPKDDAANANDRIQASPSKRARTASSSTLGLDGDDPFDMPKPFLPPPMSTYPPSSTRTRSFTSRTRSHTSVFSTRSRASGSTAFSLPDPPKPAHPGISVCPSPAHLHRMGKPVYVRHAVERFTWEDEIAGVNMGRDCVPVLWRGCGPACLDFLDQKEEVEDKEEGVVKEVGQSSTLTAGSDQDEEHVVEFQPADLSGGFADAFFEEDG